ncbi:MAG: hypothetical protein AAB867_00220 [Patescibacteria group bacterium]
MLILLSIVILLISFVIAIVSMIREQREIENRQLQPDDLGASSSTQSTPPTEREEKPQARGIDVLKSRIEQLAQEELEQQKEQPAPDLTGQITKPREKQMLTEAQEGYRPAAGQRVIEPKVVPEPGVGEIFGADGRFPVGTSGTISVADLVKKRQDQRPR